MFIPNSDTLPQSVILRPLPPLFHLVSLTNSVVYLVDSWTNIHLVSLENRVVYLVGFMDKYPPSKPGEQCGVLSRIHGQTST